ncbi:hypothetical protein EWM64_g5189, partial [Hericium alpestre]
GELQKHRETGTELHLPTGAMNEIQDILRAAPADAVAPPRAALADLQAELQATRLSLTTHVEKTRARLR